MKKCEPTEFVDNYIRGNYQKRTLTKNMGKDRTLYYKQ